MSRRTINYKLTEALPTTEITLKQYQTNGHQKSVVIKGCLIDTGSQTTVGCPQFFKKLGFTVEKCDVRYRLTNAAGQEISDINYCLKVNVVLDKVVVTNAVVFFPNSKVKFKYPVIIGLDVLSGTKLNLQGNTIEINRMSLVKNPEDFTFLDNGTHSTCSFQDDEIKHTNFNVNLHWVTELETIIKPSESCIVKVKGVIVVEDAHIVLNHRFIEILELVGFLFCDDNENLWVCLKSRNNFNTIVIRENTFLLCGSKKQEALVLEINHLVKIERLPEDEKKEHLMEYQDWVVRRKKLIESIDITSEIKTQVSKAVVFSSELEKILLKNNWCISRCETDIGFVKDFVCQFEFDQTFMGEPINRRPYRLDPHISEKVETMLLKLEDNQVLTQCNSSWNTSLLAIKKANTDQLRLVQDYSTTLNKIIRLPNSPISNSRATLNQISAQISKIKFVYSERPLITTMDICSGFWTVSMRPSHRKYLAFKHNARQFTFKRMPMGTKNSPADFCFMMASLMGDLNTEKSKVFIYMDDLIIIGCESEAIELIIY